MIYGLIIFSIFCLVIITYVGKTFFWLVDESVELQFPHMAPMVIERAYRMETIQTMFEYVDVEKFERSRFYTQPMEFSDKIVTSMEHKQHMIERQAHKLTHEMLANGFIEMVDIEMGDRDFHPYVNRTMLKVRVYKPE